MVALSGSGLAANRKKAAVNNRSVECVITFHRFEMTNRSTHLTTDGP